MSYWPNYKQNEAGIPETDTFVLKSCETKNSDYHLNEIEPYKALGEQDDVFPYMARFYGSWKQGSEYNIVLEFVGGGSLSKFFELSEQPTQAEDIMKFWKNILDIIKPVLRIHQLPKSNVMLLDVQDKVLQG